MAFDRSTFASLSLPFALLLGVTGCSSVAENDLAADPGGTDGLQYDDGPAGESGGWSGDGYDDDGGEDGTGGAADDGDAEPTPDDPEQAQEPPQACNDVDDVTLFLSPDDSNSMSSPVQAREAALDNFASIASVPIRTWEFMNYYTFAYPPAPQGQLLVTPSLAMIDAEEPGRYTLQIGVSSHAISNADRAPMNVTLVLDESGSMAGHPMQMLKETCRAIAASLKAGDKVSMVTWDTENAIVLGGYQVKGPNDSVLLEKIESLEAGGGTDLHGGLSAGYLLAEQVYDAARINRIVLVSDGGANVGVTDIELIAEHAGTNNGDGIYMVGVGVGSAASYNDELMDAVTDAGKGASVFINDEAEAWKVFSDDFVSTLLVAARDVQVQLDLPPGFEVVKFSGEEISGDPSEVEPQHLAPNDAMVFFQEIQTCAPQLLDEQSAITVTVRYHDAITFAQREESMTLTFAELLAADAAQLHKGAAIYAYAESLKAYKKSFGADAAASLAPALALVEVAEAALPEDPDLAEIRAVLQALQ